MDNETKNILKILGVAVVVLYLFKPRKKLKSKFNLKNKTEAPSVAKADSSEKEYENAVISLKAYRSAINNNEPKSELDKLNMELIKDYGIKVFICKKSGKLTARNSQGKDIAKEE